jgi:hypothetical protein
MERYRSQVAALTDQRDRVAAQYEARLARELGESAVLRRGIAVLQERLVQVMDVVREAARADDDDDADTAEGSTGVNVYVAQLAEENAGLREMLRIAGVDIIEDDPPAEEEPPKPLDPGLAHGRGWDDEDELAKAR